MQVDRVWTNARLLTMREGAAPSERGVVAAMKGLIAYAGPTEDAPEFTTATTIDCKGRWITPALIDARTGELAAVAETPWYVKTLSLSQPLHFGDYGGLPLKVVWALLDAITIVVLVAIMLVIAVVALDPPKVLFALFCAYGISGYLVYGWRKFKGRPTSVIATSTDEPDEIGLHR